ncbi:MAG: flagellin lysine-N-methylase [Clostridia bacterium]|nr:flagellin lysine-N-methylase [Clostridia bacterium]
MKHLAPNYCKEFQCIADRCRHSCCIGWEIDVDEDSLRYYESVDHPFGKKLAANIERDGEQAHFRLVGEQERCPFLQPNGLCEMILTLGEESLCDICREHPRYYLYLANREEMGLGLCCEEAARLILSQTEDTVMELIDDDGETEPTDAWERDLVAARARIFAKLQTRTDPLHARINALLSEYGAVFPDLSPAEWCDKLSALEILDPAWDRTLDMLRTLENTHDTEWQMPFEKLLLYLLYRHTAAAEDLRDLRARIAFACLGYHVVRWLSAAKKQADRSIDLSDIVGLARRYSSEIEYSEDNTESLLSFLRLHQPDTT